MAGKLSGKYSPYQASELFGLVTSVIGAEAADAINVGLTLKNPNGNILSERASFLAYLSDDAAGDSVAATAPTGGAAGGVNGVAIPLVAGKTYQLVTESNGRVDLVITESGAKSFYLIVVMPNGKLNPVGPITFA